MATNPSRVEPIYIDQGATFAGAADEYRLQLWRTWSGGGRRALWIMLNPSTADARVLDPTIRRCVAFSRAWQCDGLDVVNLFAFRSTDPTALYQVADPVGPGNDRIILAAAREAAIVVAAWGIHGALLGRGGAVLEQLAGAGVRAHCLGVNADGSPRHPLYLSKSTPLQALACEEVNA